MEKNTLLVLFASFALAGCVSYAKVNKNAVFGDGYGEATFEFGVGDSVGFGHSTTQEYRIGPTEVSADSALIKIFTWAAKSPKQFLLEANKQVYIFASMSRMYGAPGLTASGSNGCMNVSYFTPKPGTRYRVVQTGSAYGSCELSVTEVTTGSPPPDLREVLFPAPEAQE